ncbi:MAG: hypothetical protein K6E33_08640 [Lachnospiraceae bacterium]|nr:hypothetical protein [Lachnospiraceae bacterium]
MDRIPERPGIIALGQDIGKTGVHLPWTGHGDRAGCVPETGNYKYKECISGLTAEAV